MWLIGLLVCALVQAADHQVFTNLSKKFIGVHASAVGLFLWPNSALINQRARCAHQELLRLLGVKVTLDIVTVIGHVHGVRWSDLNYAVSS